MRRADERGRESTGGDGNATPRPWKRWLLVALAPPFLLVGVYLVEAWRIWSTAPVIGVDYIARINAPSSGFAPEERAWPGIRAAMSHVRSAAPVDPSDGTIAEPKRRDEWVLRVLAESAARGLGTWRDVDFGEDRTMIAPTPEFIAITDHGRTMLLSALERPFRGFELGFASTRSESDRAFFGETVPVGVPPSPMNQSLMMAPLPQIRTYRRASQLLDWDARRAAIAGDGRRVVGDLRGMLLLAEGARQPRLLVNQLVAFAIETLVNDLVLDVLAARPAILDDEQLEGIATLLTELPSDRFRITMDQERFVYEDVLQRIYSDDGNGEGFLFLRHAGALGAAGGPVPGQSDSTFESVASFLLMPVLTRAVQPRSAADLRYREAIALWEVEGRKPPHEIERQVFTKVGEVPIEDLDLRRDFPLPLLIPRLDIAVMVGWSTRLERDVAVLACRMELARRQGLDWSTVVDRLASSIDAARDPFGGEPFRLGLIDGRPAIWSVGPNLLDESGAPLRDGRSGSLRPGRLGTAPTLRETIAFWGRTPHSGATRMTGDLVLWRSADPWPAD